MSEVKIRIGICDDEKEMLQNTFSIINETAKKLKQDIEVVAYTKAKGILNQVLEKKETLDLLVLDIDMPEITGLTLAKLLREEGLDEDNLLIIFLSAHEEFVFDSIQYKPFRYVRKHVMKKELPIALQAAFVTILSNTDRELVFQTEDDEDIRVRLSEIVYYESISRKIYIHLDNGTEIITPRKTIKEMQELIPEQRFIMIHRSIVANANHISRIGEDFVTMKDESELPMSSTRAKEVRKALLVYWRDEI